MRYRYTATEAKERGEPTFLDCDLEVLACLSKLAQLGLVTRSASRGSYILYGEAVELLGNRFGLDDRFIQGSIKTPDMVVGIIAAREAIKALPEPENPNQMYLKAMNEI